VFRLSQLSPTTPSKIVFLYKKIVLLRLLYAECYNEESCATFTSSGSQVEYHVSFIAFMGKDSRVMICSRFIKQIMCIRNTCLCEFVHLYKRESEISGNYIQKVINLLQYNVMCLLTHWLAKAASCWLCAHLNSFSYYKERIIDGTVGFILLKLESNLNYLSCE
jgi:hypothetical protein